MSKTIAAKENWTGKVFANNWKILEKYNCAQSRELGLGGKNVHYRICNQDCGIETYMERTTIGDAIEDNRTIMSKCKGCINGDRKNNNTCYYATKVRIKPLYKIPDRTTKIEVNKIYGNFIVLDIKLAKEYADNQCRAIVKCRWCGAIQERRFDTILNCTASCDCFRPHSAGEMIIKSYLDKHNISYKCEQKFSDLVSPEGGYMRYDFSIFDKNHNIIAIIEFDGQQHFQPAGTYYNPTGAVQVHDSLKNKYAENNNIILKRINYTEILNTEQILDDFFNNQNFFL